MLADGFNGAATGWPRNVVTDNEYGSGVGCFNGAATGWPRNARGSLRPVSGVRRLQWGRDRMAAER